MNRIYAAIKLIHKLSVTGISLFATAVLMPVHIMAIEEPAYSLLDTRNKIEYRRYEDFIMAETLVKDERTQNSASSEGFMRLFRYISGDNNVKQEIEMTAPVIQREKIAMTAPVKQQSTELGHLVAFVLPANYTLATAPEPENPDITLRAIPARTMAVIRFSGRWTEKNISLHQEKLLEQLANDNIKIIGEPEFAAYNAPFALPFMRRNEVMVEIADPVK